MRILHIWDQAGTASIIAKYQRKLGHHSIVIKNSKHDASGVTKYYGGILVGNKYLFVIKAFLLASRYDVIHLHDAWFMVPLLAIYPEKKIIMHYHGSLVRTGIKDKPRKKWEKLIHQIIVATPDLLNYHYEKPPVYIPNPIDTELFHKRKTGSGVFASLKFGTEPEQIEYLLKQNGMNLNVDYQTIKKKGITQIPYKDFADKLSQYEYYVDIPIVNGKIIHANSTTGLQAMSVGLRVINFDYSISDSLPDKHRPENVVQEIMKLY